MTAQISPRSRADVNRANSQHSTGPTSPAGKARSSQNSGDEPASLSEAKTPWTHGLYSRQLIQPGEDPAEFDELRASLRREHQPANTTEEILVDELAQSFWRMRRFRQLEAHAWQPENLNSSIDSGMMTLIHRSANSAERSFHKTLAALTKLRKCDQAKRTGEPDPGFVPANSSGEATKKTAGKRTCEPAPPEKSVDSAALDRESIVRDQEMPRGFVSQKTAAELEAFEYFGCYPEDMEKYVESLVDSRIGSPDHAENNV